MNLKPLVWVISLAMVIAAAAPLFAQSLGDVAKREEERRKGIAAPAKVYTNKDLNPVPEGSTVPAPPPAAGTTPSAPDASAPDHEKAKDAKDKEPAKDQAYWSGRKKALQEQLDRDETFAQALQSRLNALSADFVSRDDPAQRNVIARDRDKAAAELTRLKQQIQKNKKALTDLEEEARRAGVPPGWLR